MSAISLHLKLVKLGKLQAGQVRAAWAASKHRGTADGCAGAADSAAGMRPQTPAAPAASLTSNSGAMSNDLIEQLQRLAHGFSAPCASEEAAKALFDQARAFRSVAGNTMVSESREEVSRWAGWSAAASAVALGVAGAAEGSGGRQAVPVANGAFRLPYRLLAGQWQPCCTSLGR